MPCSIDLRAALSAAICAANGVDFLLPLKPMLPELAHAMEPPCVSVIVTIVLLNDERMCATPCETFLSSRFLRGRAFLGAAGIFFPYDSFFVDADFSPAGSVDAGLSPAGRSKLRPLQG